MRNVCFYHGLNVQPPAPQRKYATNALMRLDHYSNIFILHSSNMVFLLNFFSKISAYLNAFKDIISLSQFSWSFSTRDLITRDIVDKKWEKRSVFLFLDKERDVSLISEPLVNKPFKSRNLSSKSIQLFAPGMIIIFLVISIKA